MKKQILIILILSILATTVVLLARHNGLPAWHKAPAQVAASTPAQEQASHLFHCPMHPQIIQEGPGSCPICGMALVPMQDHGEHTDNTIQIAPGVIQNIGVTTAEIREAELFHTITLNASIAIIPDRIALVNARSMGWVEHLPVGAEGLAVRKGETLATIYSPDLVAAQEDYLQALRTGDTLLSKSARNRLEVLAFPMDLIDSARQNGFPLRTVPFRSPMPGIVLDKYVVLGQNVTPGTNLFRIADLRKVWAVGKLYAADLPGIRTGVPALVQMQDRRLASRNGSVVFVSPVTDPETQTTEVRVEISNDAGLNYKPGMFATLDVTVPLGRGIAVSDQAVVRTGERTLVILALGEGRFSPHEVTLGASLGDSVEVLDGLSVGDSIVTSAQFLIDSESNLKKAAQALAKPGSGHDGHNH